MRSTYAAVQRLIITAALWATIVVSGQELTRTQISDTLFNADGSRAEGSLRISWKSFTAADGSTIPQNTISVDIIDGVAALSLAPNEGAVPDGTAYMVRYQLRGSRPFTELWVIPATGDPVSVAEIRVQSMPPPSTSVSMSQVSGLSSALNEKADRTGPNTFLAPQVLREDAPGTTNPLLGLELYDGSAGVYFRLPPLTGDVIYTLPPNDGSPNQALTTDGDGALFWSSAAGGGAGSGSAYEVLQQGGSSVAQRTVANFTSGFVLSDNVGQLRTDVTPDFGTSAGTITEGNDSRLSDARTPLSHASTHASAGGDAITPLSIGALSRTNDFMVGTSPTDPVLKIQGSPGQAAALQEWRDGAGTLAALITAEGNGFFRELGIAAPLAGTTVSQFFSIGGLKKFALSATDGVFDILRYDNSGSFLDRPLRIFRSGNIETTVRLDVTDSSVGSGKLGITGDYVELQTVMTPSTPAPGFGRLFFDSSNGELSIKKSSGSTVSLEQGGVGGTSDFLGNYASPTELTLSTGSVTLTSGGGAHLLDTEADASTDDWTAMICAAGDSFSVRAASDVRDVVIVNASIPTPINADLTLDQDGDLALGICQTANTPEVILFFDEAGEHLYRDLIGGASLATTTVRPAGTDRIGLSTHDDACQNLVDGIDGETCWQRDTNLRYTCETSDGTCDTTSEWVAEAGGSATQYATFQLVSRAGTSGARPTNGVSYDASGACAAEGISAPAIGFMACDASVDEKFWFTWQIPLNWDGTNLDFHFTNNFNTGGVPLVIMMTMGVACQDDGETIPAFNGPDSFSFTMTGVGELQTVEVASPTLTGCSAGDLIILEITRDADNASDTFAADTRLITIMLEWGTV